MRAAARGLVPLVLLVAVAAGMRSLGAHALPGRADFAFCNQGEIESLDPATTSGSSAGRILGAVFEGLTRLDPQTLQPLPGVARSWETSPDGLTWRFHLRPDARWSNGDRVTAHDFVYSFRRLLAPGTGSRYPYLLWAVRGAEEYTTGVTADGTGVGIVAAQDDELVLHLRRPCPYLAQLTAYHALSPVHRPTLEQHGSDWVKIENVVGNGPFRVTQRRLRDRTRLTRSPTYWGVDEVALSTVDAYATEGITTQLNLYLTGEVDWVIKPPPSLHEVLAPRDDHRTGPQLGMTFVRFNTTRAPFHDVRVRRALLLALDRDSLARHVMRAGQRPARSFVPQGALAGYEPSALVPPDAAAARALLAEAGYPGGHGFPPFELLYPHNETTRDFCEAVAARWRRELGLDVTPVTEPFKVYLDSSHRLLYDVAWGTWIGDYLDPSTFLEVFLADSGNNRTGWASDAYDALVRSAAGAADGDRRHALYRQAEAILLDELPIAPVYQRVNVNLVAPRVTGFSDNLLDAHPLRDIGMREPPP